MTRPGATAAIHLDLRSAVPPFEQIRAQVVGHVAAGTLRPGDRLPTVRDLASDLGVAVGTVQRAYRELEQAGAVSSRRRHGTVVTGTPSGTHGREPSPLRAAAESLVRLARSDGVSDEAVLDLVRGVLATPGAGRGH